MLLSGARRSSLRLQAPTDLADRGLLADEPVKDLTYDLGFWKQDLVAGGKYVGPRNVAISVRRSREGINQSFLRLMQLPPAIALHELGALVLREHPLHLDEQLVLGAFSFGAQDEDDLDSLLAELLQEQNLVGILARQAVRTVHIQDLDSAFGHPVSEPLQRRPHQRSTAIPIVDVKVCGKHTMPVGLGPLPERGDLAVDGRLLGLFFRRYSCI